MAEQTVSALVEGGQASAGPPLGPQLGPMGVNIGEVVNAINAQTKDFDGMEIPVDVIIDTDTKDFRIEIGTPPTAELLKNEAGIEKGSGEPRNVTAGNITIEQVVKVSQMKQNGLLSYSLHNQVKEILGSCIPLALTVNSMDPKELQGRIDAGEYDTKLSGDVEEMVEKSEEQAERVQQQNIAVQEEMEEQLEEIEEEKEAEEEPLIGEETESTEDES